MVEIRIVGPGQTRGYPYPVCKKCTSHPLDKNIPFYRGVVGGAKVLGKLSVLGRPTSWMIVGQGPIALAVGAGGGCLNIFLSSIFSLFFLPLFGRRI